MFSAKEIPSPSSLFSVYASVTTSLMLFRSVANELIPQPLRSYILSGIRYFFKPKSPYLTLIIDEFSGISRNQVYEAAQTYLCTKVSPKTERLKVSKTSKDKNLSVMLEQGEKIVDYYDGIELKWSFVFIEPERNDGSNQGRNPRGSERKFFELSFHNKYKDVILGSYLLGMLEEAKAIREAQRVLKMHTINGSHPYGGINWDSINLEHPATFETLAMEPERKKQVIDDLNRFIKRKEFYKRVGRAWKRGYLLYGPPGTGKSSLVAAMANHLKFDVYDLQLANIMRDADLRRLLLTIGNRSILVIEDIDCSVNLPKRHDPVDRSSKQNDVQLTLSGLLNFIDGLWSSCGDERIIIFTTNNKDRLDPALLRPGRMDMHIHMSYCRLHEFKILVSNYIGINGMHHTLFGEIGGLLQDVEVTPAQVAEELLKSDDPDVALQGLVKLLKRKKLEGNDELVNTEVQRKKQKLTDNKKTKSLRKSKRRSYF